MMTHNKKGWKQESARHSLAAKGIKTGRKKKKILTFTEEYLLGRWASTDTLKELRKKQAASPSGIIDVPQKIHYCGKNYVMDVDLPMIRGEVKGKMFLSDAFDEEEKPHWSNTAQKYLDYEKKAGRKAYTIHSGRMHYLFMER